MLPSNEPPCFWRCGKCGTPNPLKGYLTNCLGCGAPRPPLPASTATKVRQKAEEIVEKAGHIGGRWLKRVTWAYSGVLVVILALIWWLSDRWWPASMLMLMPRWVLLVPVVALAAIAGWRNQRKLWIWHAALVLIVLFPLMGFNVPIGKLWARRAAGTPVRIMTLNQDKASLRAYDLIRVIQENDIHVICLQENYTGPEGTRDPVLENYFDEHQWHRTKEKTIASRWPIVEELPPLEDEDGEQGFWRARVTRARVRAPGGSEFIVASVHMPTLYFAMNSLASGDFPTVQRHIEWRAERMNLVNAALLDVGDDTLLVGGDFNMPEDSTLMASLRIMGLRYAFDAAGWGFGYTRPSHFPWVRIDHILGSSGVQFTRCWTGPRVGSDHLPLLAEAILPTGSTSPKPPSKPAAEPEGVSPRTPPAPEPLPAP